MVIGAIVAPVLFNHGDVQIPALNFGLPRTNAFEGPFVESNRGQARRCRETLLCSGITNVDALAIDADGMSAQRSHSVDDEQCPMCMRKVSQTREVLQYARR